MKHVEHGMFLSTILIGQERIERFIGKEKVQTIIEQVKEMEQVEKANKRSNWSHGLSR